MTAIRIGRPPRAPRRYPLRLAIACVLGTVVATLLMLWLAPLIDLFLLPVEPSRWLINVIFAVGLGSSLLTTLAVPRRPKTRRPRAAAIWRSEGTAANSRAAWAARVGDPAPCAPRRRS